MMTSTIAQFAKEFPLSRMDVCRVWEPGNCRCASEFAMCAAVMASRLGKGANHASVRSGLYSFFHLQDHFVLVASVLRFMFGCLFVKFASSRH